MLAKAPEDRPTLPEVAAALRELEHAHVLNRPEDHAKYLARRPTLVRRYSSTHDLARPLLTDLTSGVTWTSASGESPPLGAPINVRYEVPAHGLAIDFGAILERRLGGEREGSQLVRFDRVSKSRLDRILMLSASLPDGVAESTPIAESWEAPAETAEEPSSIPGPELDAEPVQTLVISSVMGISRPAPPPPSAKLDERLAVAVEKPRFGLGLKVMLLSTLVAVGAVSAVMALALDRVRSDRKFYVDELVLRSSRQVADLIQEKTRSHRELLTLLAVNDGDLQLLAGDLTQLTRCQKAQCRTLKGDPPNPERIQATNTLAEARLEQRATEGGIDLALRHGDRVALGRVSGGSLLDPNSVPSGFSAFLVAPDGTMVARVGDAPWPLLPSWANGALPQHAGTAESPGPSPHSVGWAKIDAGLVIMAAPNQLAADSVRVLAEKILMVAAMVLLFAGLVAAVFGRGMTQRLRRLTRLATDVGRGQFSDTEVSGKDEVGVLARAFNRMSSALRERDDEVLRMRQVLSEEESRSWQKQMSQWLEADLSLALDGMREIIGGPDGGDAGHVDRRRLGTLVEQAQRALKSAFSRAAIGARRIDFAATIRDAVDLARDNLKGARVRLSFEAPNAVLFPRLPAQESELREIVLTLVRYGAESAPGEGGGIRITAYTGEGTLCFAVSYELAGRSREAARRAIRAVESLLVSHRASATLVREANGVAAVLEFPLAEPSAAAEAS
jgi:HAMP domain-containing protein